MKKLCAIRHYLGTDPISNLAGIKSVTLCYIVCSTNNLGPVFVKISNINISKIPVFSVEKF